MPTSRSSENRPQIYRRLFENSRAVQLLIDPTSGRIRGANPEACRFYGYSKNKLTSLSIFDINTAPFEAIEEKLQWAAAGRWEGARGGDSYDSFGDGRRAPYLRGRPRRSFSGGVPAEGSEGRRAPPDGTSQLPLILFGVDAEGRFILLAGQGLQPHGTRPQKVMGRSAFELLADWPQITTNIRRALSGEEFTD